MDLNLDQLYAEAMAILERVCRDLEWWIREG